MSWPAFSSLRVADPNERRLWLREALRPFRGAGGGRLTLRGAFRPERGRGETYVWLCRSFAGSPPLPAALCLAEATPSGALTPRGEIGALDFITIYGPADFLRGLAAALDPRAASQSPDAAPVAERQPRTA